MRFVSLRSLNDRGNSARSTTGEAPLAQRPGRLRSLNDREGQRIMWIGWIEFDLLLGDVRSLKEKRSILRPLIADLSRRTEVAAGEVGSHDLHRRAQLGVAVVAADASHATAVLDRAERLIADDHPELVLLSARRRMHSSED